MIHVHDVSKLELVHVLVDCFFYLPGPSLVLLIK